MRALIPVSILALAGISLHAADVDISKLPPAATTQIDFDRDIKPIFEAACFRCHGSERPKSGFSLIQRESALKGGENGVDIVPGKSAESPLIHYVSYLVEDMEMPPPGKTERLTAEQIGLLRAWIDQGAPYGKPPSGPAIAFAVTTGVRVITVSGDEKKFAEHAWMREGWAGGIERLTLQDKMTNGVIVTAEARAIFDEADYLVKLRLEKPDFGFVQMGFEQYRRYTDDTGLSFPGYPVALSTLGRDFEMDIGRSWIDFGLTLPHWPRMTLGYEHQYRDGDKASLQYDFVTPDLALDPKGRALRPTRRVIDEEVHIMKFDLDHEVGGYRIVDSARGEFYNLTSERERFGAAVAASASGATGARERDKQDHFQGANSLLVEKQLKRWLFVSAGYLYSRLDGGAEFDRSIFVPVNPAFPSFLGEDSNGILIDQDTHAFNATTSLGPWDGFSAFGSFQSDWMRQDSIAASRVRPVYAAVASPSDYYSNLSRNTFSENFGLKYTKIPATVLRADARWQQEDTGQLESYVLRDGLDNHDDFSRDTDAEARFEEYRAGVTVSPWTQVIWSADYKHRDRSTDYDHNADLSGEGGNGYSAYIRHRDIETDGVETKLALRLVSWLRTTFKYERVSTDYHTQTDTVAGGGPLSGPILAGNYDADIYSANVTLSPWQRLRFSMTFAYTDTKLISGDNNGVQVVPYEGDIYSVLSSATFVLTPKADVTGSYFFSQANDDQSNAPGGLPAGLAYDRHGLMAGLTYHWKPTLSTKLQYGFFNYNEPSTQNANDYTAHAVFASMTWTMQ